eukprot:3845978-Pleurochrysis_carterae.AAC.1
MMRLWPYVFTVMVGLILLHWFYIVGAELLVQRYMEQAHDRAVGVRGGLPPQHAFEETPSGL